MSLRVDTFGKFRHACVLHLTHYAIVVNSDIVGLCTCKIYEIYIVAIKHKLGQPLRYPTNRNYNYTPRPININ